MSDLEKLKNDVLSRYAYEKVTINEKERRNLSPEERNNCSHLIVDEYEYRRPVQISDEDLDSFIALKSLEAQMETMNAVVIIKNIVVFLVVLSIVVSIVFFILLAMMR